MFHIFVLKQEQLTDHHFLPKLPLALGLVIRILFLYIEQFLDKAHDLVSQGYVGEHTSSFELMSIVLLGLFTL